MSELDFDALVAAHRGELHSHCYRMLGSIHEADDALQESLVEVWKGLSDFEGPVLAVRSWLYRIATKACLHQLEGRPKRLLSADVTGPIGADEELGESLTEAVWVEPYPDAGLSGPRFEPGARYELRESIELAFVAALQHLEPNERAVLIARDVLGFSDAEVAEWLDTSLASVIAELRGARETVEQRLPARSQQAEQSDLGEDGVGELVERFVAAWERADVPGILDMLATDATFSMPPLPAWFDGREEIGRFIERRVFALEWRFAAARVGGQPAIACYNLDPEDGGWVLGALNMLSLRGGEVCAITSFLAPDVTARTGVAMTLV